MAVLKTKAAAQPHPELSRFRSHGVQGGAERLVVGFPNSVFSAAHCSCAKGLGAVQWMYSLVPFRSFTGSQVTISP
ncbi:MAG: hypothetical protein VB099_17095 [Candidatus Limiplasma sp.]|nr:hypothetical protein [Candidatus Limiplasma sp.]